MSIIHQALSQSNQPTADGRARKFNPLAKGPSNESTRIWIPIAGTVLLTAAVLLVLLPSDKPSTNSTPVSTDVAAAQNTQTDTATPAANTDLAIAANADTDKPTVNAQSQETVSEPISEETQSLLIDSLIEEPIEDSIAEEKSEPAPVVVEQTIAEEPIALSEERTLIMMNPLMNQLLQNQSFPNQFKTKHKSSPSLPQLQLPNPRKPQSRTRNQAFNAHPSIGVQTLSGI